MTCYSNRPFSELRRRVAPRVAVSLPGQATTGCRAPHQAPARAREPPRVAFGFLFLLRLRTRPQQAQQQHRSATGTIDGTKLTRVV